MSQIDTTSVEPTPPRGGTVDVHKEKQKQQAIEEAKKKGVEMVKDLADIVMRQQGPPGTPSLRPKRKSR